ncbi:hypothetical protein GLAREA_09262 [Glarea lozoyensis ATCC 20868]|uniref:Uncharacterized protein n=1 Tax=Glarea lozoyensis (strain ATCC 20868 / MF5171) TaxID=1116229 RepID=S3DIW9_GLAL2|nr:uncharacterized protein GLAREA_09262 [Glarea lozoyensis ATCC 20868]EPE37099.1 hypothetical protein GLAREA_09262 [Glarea lozoyensis ATCC 20868]
MFSLRPLLARNTAAKLCTRCLSTIRPIPRPTILPSHTLTRSTPPNLLPSLSRNLPSHRTYASKSTADTLIDEITDQYATARDEFEIATEETEKQTTYGQADRDAARAELDKLKGMYEDALRTEDGEEIKRRVGGRIRELEGAVRALEESVEQGDH